MRYSAIIFYCCDEISSGPSHWGASMPRPEAQFFLLHHCKNRMLEGFWNMHGDG
jgi:hypothetical protein